MQKQDRIFVVQHPGGMVVDVREEDMQSCLEWLTNASRAERRRVLQSVNRALANAARLVKSGYASERDLKDACNDVGIWFANEVGEGRVDLANGRYKDGPLLTADYVAAFKNWHSTTTVEDTIDRMSRLRSLRAN